jgi:hypothetical protein
VYTDSRDEREIYRNIVRIARAMDERNWAEIEDLTAPDATADLGKGPLASRAEIVALLRSFIDECGPTQHMIGNVLIDVTGDTATSRAYVADMHLGTGDLEGQYFRTLADYHDSWVRTDNGWKLTRRHKIHHGTMGDIAVLTHAKAAPPE